MKWTWPKPASPLFDGTLAGDSPTRDLYICVMYVIKVCAAINLFLTWTQADQVMALRLEDIRFKYLDVDHTEMMYQ